MQAFKTAKYKTNSKSTHQPMFKATTKNIFVDFNLNVYLCLKQRNAFVYNFES